MKRAFFSLLVATLLLGGSVGARDLKTMSGDVYKNIEVRSRDATGIQIMHDDGVVFLDFKNLSEADQKDFGYNADLYADGWKQKFEAEKKRREQAELAAQQANTYQAVAQAFAVARFLRRLAQYPLVVGVVGASSCRFESRADGNAAMPQSCKRP